MSVRIRIESDDGQRALLKPLGRMADAMEQSFAWAVRGGIYSKEFGCYLLSWEVLPGVISRLKNQRFDVELSPAVIGQVEGNIGVLQRAVEQAKLRVVANAKHLYGYQQTGVIKLASRRRLILGDSMGLGKTRQCIFAVPDRAPVIIVSPASVKGEWRDQWQALRPEFRVKMISGRGTFEWPKEGEVAIINPDILPPPPLAKCAYRYDRTSVRCERPRRYGKITCKIHRKDYPYVDPSLCIFCGRRRHHGMDCLELETGTAPGGLVIGVDEAHLFKVPTSNRTIALKVLSSIALSRGGFTWGLTGTPVEKDADELWTVLDNFDLASEAFGSYDNYVKLMGGKRGAFGGFVFPDYRKQPFPKEAVEHLSTVMLRRVDTEELNLPPMTYHDIPIDLSAGLKREVDDFIREAALDIEASNFLDKLAFTDYAPIRKALATAKIPALEDFLAMHEGIPLIVFSAHRAPIERLANRKGCTVIHGGIADLDERHRRAKAFQAGKYDIIAGTIDTMGVGLTLTRATHMVFLDLEWNPTQQWQAEKRFHRISQDKPVFVHRLVGSHALERRIAELLAKKTALFDMTVGSVKPNTEVKIDDLDLEGITVNKSPNVLQPLSAEELEKVALKNPRRQPRTSTEKWAMDGILKLAANDKDHAQKRNGMGFSQSDTRGGHSLAAQLSEGLGLTDVQWSACVNIARQYRRQIGAPPSKGTS